MNPNNVFVRRHFILFYKSAITIIYQSGIADPISLGHFRGLTSSGDSQHTVALKRKLPLRNVIKWRHDSSVVDALEKSLNNFEYAGK